MKFTKKRIAALVAGLFLLALLGGSVYYVLVSNNRQVELAPDAIVQVERGDLTAVFMTSATVESGQQGQFEILDGTRVTDVYVQVGEAVQAGDLLASFDASTLDAMLRQRRADYQNARRSYRDYLRNAQAAPNRASDLQRQIAEVEARIAQLQAEETVPPPPPQEPETPQGNQQLDELRRAVAGLMGNTAMANWLVNQILLAEGGNVEQTITALQNLLSGSLMGGFDMGGFDMSAMMGMGGINTELMGASIQLMQLRMQESMLGLQAGVSLENVYRALVESAGNAYRQAEETIDRLRSGWVAAYDGVVREVNITAGEVYRSAAGGGGLDMTAVLASLAMGNADIGTMLGGMFGGAVNGMVIEYYPFMARFLLSEHNIAQVNVGQNVRVTSATGAQFAGEVSFISPVAADGGSGFDLGSIMGGSGGARGVEARIVIPEPDLSLTIGLDVSIAIEMDAQQDVLLVPASAVQLDSESERHFVFTLERMSRTVHKTYVEVGIFDSAESVFEIIGGLEEGDEILRIAQQRGLEDGDRVRIQ